MSIIFLKYNNSRHKNYPQYKMDIDMIDELYDKSLLRGADTTSGTLKALAQMNRDLQLLTPPTGRDKVSADYAFTNLRDGLHENNVAKLSIGIKELMVLASGYLESPYTVPYSRGIRIIHPPNVHPYDTGYNAFRELYRGAGGGIVGNNEYTITPPAQRGIMPDYGQPVYQRLNYVKAPNGTVRYHPDTLAKNAMELVYANRSGLGMKELEMPLILKFAKTTYQMAWLLHKYYSVVPGHYLQELAQLYYENKPNEQGISPYARQYADELVNSRRQMQVHRLSRQAPFRPGRAQSAEANLEAGNLRQPNLLRRGILNYIARGRYASDTSDVTPEVIDTFHTNRYLRDNYGEFAKRDLKMMAQALEDKLDRQTQSGVPPDPKDVANYQHITQLLHVMTTQRFGTHSGQSQYTHLKGQLTGLHNRASKSAAKGNAARFLNRQTMRARLGWKAPQDFYLATSRPALRSATSVYRRSSFRPRSPNKSMSARPRRPSSHRMDMS